MNRLTLLALVVFGAAAFVRLFARRGPPPALFVPDPTNDKSITLRGLRRDELDQVLQTFWAK